MPLRYWEGGYLSSQYTAPAPQQIIVPVSKYAGSEIDPSFSPDGKQIAFSWDGEKSENNFSFT